MTNQVNLVSNALQSFGVVTVDMDAPSITCAAPLNAWDDIEKIADTHGWEISMRSESRERLILEPERPI